MTINLLPEQNKPEAKMFVTLPSGPPFKQDEAFLLALIYRFCSCPYVKQSDPLNRSAYVRDIVYILHRADYMHSKRAYYVLEKFVTWGFYEYGVCVDLGWLTEKGYRAAAPFYHAFFVDGSIASIEWKVSL